MTDDLMNAILSLNAYGNAGPLKNVGFELGGWTRVLDKQVVSSNFSASLYNNGSNYILAYRGTTDLLGLQGDILNGYGVGAGSPYANDAGLATDFYKQSVAFAGNIGSNVTLTGHSMGGGLAGFVSALYGAKATIFDNMAFEQAVSRAYHLSTDTSDDPNFPSSYDPELKDRIYGAGSPVAPDASHVDGWYVEGEFLAFNRWNATLLPNPINPHSGSSLSMWQLHSQSLLVTLLYAQQNGLVGWEKIAPFLMSSLYNDDIAKAAGADQYKADGATSAEAMLGMIAYSALESGVLPFGSTAIKALLNDASDISKFVYSGSAATSEVDKIAYEGISQIIAQYSGQLAAQKSIDANRADGIVQVTDKVATISLSSSQWETWTGGSVDVDPNIVGLDHLVTGAVTSVVQPNINEDAAELFDDLFATDADELISGVTLIQITDEAGAKLDGGSAALTHGGKDGGALQIGSVDNPTTFVGGAGTNIMIGQYGDETGERSDRFDLSVGNNIVLESKAGTATLDFSAIEDVAPDTWNMVEGGYGGSQTFVFENPDHAPLTIVYGASDTDTFDIKSDPDKDVAVYVLEFADVTEANFLSLNPDLIEKYIDEKYDLDPDNGYGPLFDEKIVLINPSAEDILKYNGDVIDDPTSYQSQITVDQNAFSFYDEAKDDVFRKVDPNNNLNIVGDSAVGGVWAKITDTWTDTSVTKSIYGLRSEDNYINYSSGKLLINHLRQNSTNVSYTTERDDGFSSESITHTRGFYDGSLSIFGFRHGDFGVNFGENNYVASYSMNSVTNAVSEWAKATVGTTELPHLPWDPAIIVPDITGQLPGVVGPVLETSSFADAISGKFATNAEYDEFSSYDRIVLELVDFARAVELKGSAGADNMNGTRGANVVRSLGGDDTVFGLGGDDELIGGEGSDTLSGGEGSDTYTYAFGDGNDVITDGTSDASTTDVLNLADLNSDAVTKSRIGDDLVITVSTTGETIRVANQFLGFDGIERIEFVGGVAWSRADINAGLQDEILGTSGNDILTGTADNDIFIGGLGDDRLLGAEGSDTYIYRAGDGSDYIDDEANEPDSVDVLLFSNLNAVDVVATRNGVNLDITVLNTGDVITLDEQWYSDTAYWGFEKVEFADGSSWDRSLLMAVTADSGLLMGTSADDTLTGTADDDIIAGIGGDDIIFGATGDDRIFGGDGDDVLFPGVGNDLVDGGTGSDTTIIAGARSEFTISAIDNLTLKVDGSGVSTLIKNVEWLVFDAPEGQSDVSVNVVDYLLLNAPQNLVGTGGNNTLFGGNNNDTISGLAGDDVIFPSLGNDVVDGGEGSDTIIFVGRGSDFSVSFVDSTTVRVGGNGVSTLISNSEWIVFDAPEGEADQSINVLDFIGQNGDEPEARSGNPSGSAGSLDVVTDRISAAAPADLASADIIAFPGPAIANSAPSGDLGSFDEIASQGEDDSSFTSADIISLEEFAAGLQSDTHSSDLWFEPEPIGALV